MKKIFITISLIACAMTVVAQSADVTIKRGKAIIDEAYYYQLKQKAAELDRLSQQNDSLQQQLKKVTTELNKNKSKSPEIRSFVDSASYAIGKDLATNWQRQNLGLNLNVVAQSLIDVASGKNNWTQAQMSPILRRFQSEFEKREQKKREDMLASVDKNKEEGEQFLKENGKKKEIKTTKSGLQYQVLQKGNGNRPTANSTVKVHYTGKLLSGKVFDSSIERGEPMEFPVGAVIPGWTEGLQLMDEGSKYILYIPSSLAYGDNPVGDIPPGSTLIFEVELIQIVK
ncbi:MAG: FKBP-type peptidyl-prolyl cis-trans isomerase [Bacteroidales bacterium]|nr:FKBP-type peptidyl-prolyl cis-trans isomerase [Bacteroidales bacterium]